MVSIQRLQVFRLEAAIADPPRPYGPPLPRGDFSMAVRTLGIELDCL